MKGVHDAVTPVSYGLGSAKDFYSLIGEVTRVLEANGLKTQSHEFIGRAVQLGTYDEVLALSREYVQFHNGDSHERETDRETCAAS